MDRLLKAAIYAAEQHAGQTRKNSGDIPYINHPVAVAALPCATEP